MQAYNTKLYLEQCLNSVLSQTYSDWKFILVDNGCTDGSSRILHDFAEKDNRVQLIRYEENQQGFWHRLIRNFAVGNYLTFIDSDDWWEPDFLERLIVFLNENHLDFAVTGTISYIESTHTHTVLRQLERPCHFSIAQFAQQYPVYWVFPSTVWGSILKMPIYLKSDFSALEGAPYPYGSDTMTMLQYMKQCTNIGIDNSALYHYRIHPQSVTYQYNPRRFDANVACYEQIREFLELHHTFDPPKQEWLKLVHLSSMLVTLNLLKSSALSSNEKLAECARIAEHPLTAVALTNRCNEREQWLSHMWEIVFTSIRRATEISAENLRIVLLRLAPSCAAAISPTSLGLFVRETGLQRSLQEDDREQLTYQILSLILQKQYIKQYDLGQLLCDLLPENSLLHGISDTRFFQEYADICRFILNGMYFNALEQMTGMLFQSKKLYAEEVFLNLYLTVAALVEEIPAFLFGKLRLARFYLNQDRRSECRAIMEELVDMGVDNEDLDALRLDLEKIADNGYNLS